MQQVVVPNSFSNLMKPLSSCYELVLRNCLVEFNEIAFKAFSVNQTFMKNSWFFYIYNESLLDIQV